MWWGTHAAPCAACAHTQSLPVRGNRDVALAAEPTCRASRCHLSRREVVLGPIALLSLWAADLAFAAEAHAAKFWARSRRNPLFSPRTGGGAASRLLVATWSIGLVDVLIGVRV